MIAYEKSSSGRGVVLNKIVVKKYAPNAVRKAGDKKTKPETMSFDRTQRNDRFKTETDLFVHETGAVNRTRTLAPFASEST